MVPLCEDCKWQSPVAVIWGWFQEIDQKVWCFVNWRRTKDAFTINMWTNITNRVELEIWLLVHANFFSFGVVLSWEMLILRSFPWCNYLHGWFYNYAKECLKSGILTSPNVLLITFFLLSTIQLKMWLQHSKNFPNIGLLFGLLIKLIFLPNFFYELNLNG